jgi:hypothetical protein
MDEKIERNPQAGDSMGSGESSFSFRDTPSPSPLGPPPSRSDNWVENPEGHLNRAETPAKDTKSSHIDPSAKPKLLFSSLKPNYKLADSDRLEISKEEGEGNEFHRDQHLNLKVDGKIENSVLQNRGLRPPQTIQTFPFDSSAARLTMETQWTMSNPQGPFETGDTGTPTRLTMEHWAKVPPPPSPPSEILNEQNPALPGAESFHDPSPHFQSPGAGYGVLPVEGTFGGEMDGFRNSKGFGGFGSGNLLYDLLIGNKEKDEVYASRREVRKVDQQLKMKMRIILFLLLMGDVQGAVRQLLFEGERMDRVFNRLLVKKLGKVREGKTKILLALGRKPPPRAWAATSGNTQDQERDQKAQMRYTQWTTITTQLTSEIQQGERELMGMIEEARNHINKMWETYQGLKEAEARTSRMLFQSFRE